MKYFIIIDETTGRRWSRNKWGGLASTPDLYQSANAAYRQITEGKISVMRHYDQFLNPKVHEVHLLTASEYRLLTA